MGCMVALPCNPNTLTSKITRLIEKAYRVELGIRMPITISAKEN